MKNQGGEDAIGGKQGTYYSEGLEKEIAKRSISVSKGEELQRNQANLTGMEL